MRYGSFAFAEHTGGYSLEEISATVRKEGEPYIVKGTKGEVIHGGHAHGRVVLLGLEGTTGTGGLVLLAIPGQPQGMHIITDMEKLGLVAAPSVSFRFEHVAVPATDLLGQPGQSSVIRAATLYQILRAGVACGMARASLESSLHYAKDRVGFGKPIVSYPSIAILVAEMAMKLDAARLLLLRAAVSWAR